MPYIKKRDRKKYKLLSDSFIGIKTAGELNYLITKLLIRYWNAQKKESYQTINDILGALEGAKFEFYRRVAGKYEDEKIDENGDVY